jgi:hypothetical protein
MKRNKLKLWYHIALMTYYGRLTDSVLMEEVSDGWRNMATYDRYFNKYIQHKAMVRELKKGA